MPTQIEKAMDLLPPALASNPNFVHLARLLEDLNTHTHHSCSHRRIAFRPAFDLVEAEGAFELYGDLPGVRKEDLSVELTDARTIVVKGTVSHDYNTLLAPDAVGQDAEGGAAGVEETPKPAATATQPTFLVSERGSGSFQRTFKLPLDVNRQGVVANFEHGVLHVCVPKPVKDAGDVQRVEIL